MWSFPFEPFFYNWLVLGILFLIIEVATFTLLFLWLAIAALIMAAINFFFPTMAFTWQLITFSALSVISATLWYVNTSGKQDKAGDKRMNNRALRYIGRSAVLAEPIVHGRGKIQLEDSFWRVECDEDLPAGQSVVIYDAIGVILHVKSADAG